LLICGNGGSLRRGPSLGGGGSVLGAGGTTAVGGGGSATADPAPGSVVKAAALGRRASTGDCKTSLQQGRPVPAGPDGCRPAPAPGTGVSVCVDLPALLSDCRSDPTLYPPWSMPAELCAILGLSSSSPGTAVSESLMADSIGGLARMAASICGSLCVGGRGSGSHERAGGPLAWGMPRGGDEAV
jgi:hypothetical protein